MKKFELLLLSAVLLIATSARLYKINRPIADWHSWRQADTAAVARNFIKEGYNPLIPKFDDMSTQTNTLDNPNRYRFVEFPIYNSIVAAVWIFTGVNESAARLVTVLMTLGSTLLLYLLVKHFSDSTTALLSALFFAIIPYNVFYSSSILPGPTMVFGILGLYLSFAKWLQNEKNILLLIAVLFANIAILSWPIALFFMLPVIYLAFEKYGLKAFTKVSLWLFAISSIAPFIAWRVWMLRFPEGIPNWQFLINEGNIRFKGAFFRWLIAERIGKLILTVSGSFLFLLGIIRSPQNKEKFFYYSWLVSVAVYFVVFASGNVRHDYYQIPFIPPAAAFMAIGTKTLFNLPSTFNRLLGPIVALAAVIFMLAFGFFEVRGYWWINKPQIVSAGKAADRLLPKEATVIAPYNGDTAFLYQTNRYGYPLVDRPLEKFLEQETKYLVSVDPNDSGIQNLAKQCRVIEQTKEFVIVEMFKECIGK